jgi:hypothetical protein
VLNSEEAADSETSKGAARDRYELHRVGHPQKDDQLLREKHQWQGVVGGQDSGDAAAVKVAHPLMLRAIAVAKKREEQIEVSDREKNSYWTPKDPNNFLRHLCK